MSQIRNMLEPSSEVRNLLKRIRKISALECSKEANFNKFFVAGCVSSFNYFNLFFKNFKRFYLLLSFIILVVV